MITANVEKALNEQINKEMYSAYLYMSMSAQCGEMGLKGIAVWFMAQYHEEMFHAMKIYEYVARQGAKVRLGAIEQPQQDYSSVLEMYEKTLDHEKVVTKSINDLMDLAIEHKDHATQAFLTWYVTEQVEEEESATDILQRLKLMGDNTGGLYLLDKELGTRVVNAPVNFSQGLEAAAGA